MTRRSPVVTELMMVQERLSRVITGLQRPRFAERQASERVLSEKQVFVLAAVANSKSNEWIAGRMCLSVHTVKGIRADILRRLGVSTFPEAVAVGLVSGEMPARMVGALDRRPEVSDT